MLTDFLRRHRPSSTAQRFRMGDKHFYAEVDLGTEFDFVTPEYFAQELEATFFDLDSCGYALGRPFEGACAFCAEPANAFQVVTVGIPARPTATPGVAMATCNRCRSFMTPFNDSLVGMTTPIRETVQLIYRHKS